MSMSLSGSRLTVDLWIEFVSMVGEHVTKTKKGQELPSTQLLPKMVETTEVSVGNKICIYVWAEVYLSYVICNMWQCALKNVCNKA